MIHLVDPRQSLAMAGLLVIKEFMNWATAEAATAYTFHMEGTNSGLKRRTGLGRLQRSFTMRLVAISPFRPPFFLALQTSKKESKSSSESKRNRELKKDLRRKEKALVEVVALLAL